jgi:isoleucyl-tRNA synthetase
MCVAAPPFLEKRKRRGQAGAYQTLHRVLVTVCRLIAPVVPFTAEAMYQNLKAPLQDAPASVHLCAWPEVDESLRNADLIQEVEGVLQCVSLGHAARKDSGVKVRQPLRRVLVQTPSAQARSWVENWRDTILDELNVKELELLDDAGELVEYSLKANLPKLGKKLGKQMGVVRQAFEGASPEEARRVGEASRRGEEFTLRVGDEEMTFAPDEVLVQTEQKSGYQFASENGWAVALDTTLDEALIDEGLGRDFVRAIQQARKDAGFQVSDHITILLTMDDDSRMPQVFENWGEYIQNETLADELRLVESEYPELQEAKIGDETVRLRVERLALESDAAPESAAALDETNQ